MLKTKWGSVIFTAYKFFDPKELLFFVVPEDIHTEGFAAAQHSLQGTPPCPRQSVRRRPFWRPAAGCRRHGRWCSSKTMPSSCCAVCRRTSSPPTTMTMRDTSGRCWRRAACVPVAAPLWPPPRGLILTVSHQDQIGQLYPQILSLLVHGACRELF